MRQASFTSNTQSSPSRCDAKLWLSFASPFILLCRPLWSLFTELVHQMQLYSDEPYISYWQCFPHCQYDLHNPMCPMKLMYLKINKREVIVHRKKLIIKPNGIIFISSFNSFPTSLVRLYYYNFRFLICMNDLNMKDFQRFSYFHNSYLHCKTLLFASGKYFWKASIIIISIRI